MRKIAVVYWSGTGNTQAMAEAVLEGAKGDGAEAELFTVSEFDASKIDSYNAIAFGCPAMGRRCWKKANSSQCSTLWKECSAVKRSGCSALMDGATENGCGIGRKPAGRRA
ncbi:MAG: hypothetical protein HFH12_02585 [Dorea sp.]|nr:hypothetical protein [Dorea sp.]